MSDKVKVWQVKPKYGGPNLIVHNLNEIDWLDTDADVGDIFLLERVEMTQEEVENLEEFNGW